MSSENVAEELVDPLLGPEKEAEPPDPLRQRRTKRLLDRDADFHQSRGKWQIQRIRRSTAMQETNVFKRIWDTWFYTLIYQRTSVLMLILFLSYTFLVIFFAVVYLAVSHLGTRETIDPSSGVKTFTPFCDMDIKNHMEALYFSLSTMTTIGYGVSDYYFGGCWTPLLLVLAQVCTAITFDAIAIGVLFQRFSRGHKRAKSVVFSDSAVITMVRGVYYLMFRIAELHSHQLLEAKIRAYCVRSEIHGGKRYDFITKSLKLRESQILMSLPQTIVHEIDKSSPLYPTSGESIQDFLDARSVEIVVLVEGTDELTNSIIQTRHSYKTEFKYQEIFNSCVSDDDRCQVDFSKFHDTEPLPENATSCPFVLEV